MSKFKRTYNWLNTWTYIKIMRIVWWTEGKLEKLYGDNKLNGK